MFGYGRVSGGLEIEFIAATGLIFFHIFAGWWLVNPSEKYEFVDWDDDIPKI